eukprot:UN27291
MAEITESAAVINYVNATSIRLTQGDGVTIDEIFDGTEAVGDFAEEDFEFEYSQTLKNSVF